MTNPWVCLECGGRQAAPGACAACSREDVLDARKEDVRGLMADVELRLRDKREARIRWTAVVIGVSVIAICWTIPGYWHLRGRLYPGIPFLLDQWAFMALIGFGLLKLGEKLFSNDVKRFPYLDDLQQIDG